MKSLAALLIILNLLRGYTIDDLCLRSKYQNEEFVSQKTYLKRSEVVLNSYNERKTSLKFLTDKNYDFALQWETYFSKGCERFSGALDSIQVGDFDGDGADECLFNLVLGGNVGKVDTWIVDVVGSDIQVQTIQEYYELPPTTYSLEDGILYATCNLHESKLNINKNNQLSIINEQNTSMVLKVISTNYTTYTNRNGYREIIKSEILVNGHKINQLATVRTFYQIMNLKLKVLKIEIDD